MWTEHDFYDEEPGLAADKWAHAQDHLLGLIEALYEKPNWAKLESHLEEIAHALEVDFQFKDLQWEPVGSKKDNYLRGMKDANEQHERLESGTRAKLRAISDYWRQKRQK